MSERKHLAAAIVRAQREAKAVKKDSHNHWHKYQYASGEDVIAGAREALAGAGLAFVVVRYQIEHLEPHDVLSATYALIHESGERMEVASSTPIIPEKGRPADKALAAAKTYDLAYAMRGVLALPRVDGEDVDQRDDRGHVPQRRQQRAPSPDLRELEDAVRREVARLGADRVREVAQSMHGDTPRDQWTAQMWTELVAELGHERPRQREGS